MIEGQDVSDRRKKKVREIWLLLISKTFLPLPSVPWMPLDKLLPAELIIPLKFSQIMNFLGVVAVSGGLLFTTISQIVGFCMNGFFFILNEFVTTSDYKLLPAGLLHHHEPCTSSLSPVM